MAIETVEPIPLLFTGAGLAEDTIRIMSLTQRAPKPVVGLTRENYLKVSYIVLLRSTSNTISIIVVVSLQLHETSSQNLSISSIEHIRTKNKEKVDTNTNWKSRN